MILSNFKAMNPRAKNTDACAYTDSYSWIGLLMVNGVKKWSDETAYDYDLDKNSAGYRSYVVSCLQIDFTTFLRQFDH